MIRVRRYSPGDEWELTRLYNLCYARWRSPFLVRTPREWRWRFLEQPEADPEGILVAEDDGRVVSMGVVSVRRVWLGGRTGLLGIMNDAATHPEYRGRGIVGRLGEVGFEYLRDRGVDLMLGYVQRGSPTYRMLLRLGFAVAGTCYLMARALSFRRLLESGWVHMALLASRRPMSASARGGVELGAAEAAKLFDDVFRGRVAAAVYSDEYVRWKYLGYRRRRVYWIKGGAVASASVKVFALGRVENWLPVCVLDDLWWRDVRALRLLLNWACSRSGAALAYAVVDDVGRRALEMCGFSRMWSILVMARPFSPLPRGRWFIHIDSVLGEP